MIKKLLKLLLSLIIIILLAALGYVAYVFLTYHRIEDNINVETVEIGAVEDVACDVDTEYTIATYNVGFGAYTPDYSFFMDGGVYSRCLSEDASKDNVYNAANKIIEVDPDFMMFEEVDRDATRSYGINQEEVINEVFDGYYHNFSVNYDSAYLFYPFNEPIGKSLSGIGFYSKSKIESAVRRSLPISTSFSKLIDLDRCYMVSKVPVANGKYVCFYTVHLSAYSNNPEVRKGQMDMLFEDFQSELDAGNYIVCGGDFNRDLKFRDESVSEGRYDWTYAFPRSELPKGMNLAMDTCLSEEDIDLLPETERNTDAPYTVGVTEEFMLDGFVISDNIECLGYNVYQIGYLYSDHDPVVMKFKLK